ncbi:hypothetical protein CBS101457_000726 [Exobasidium rhododendri]|nr:hypothetical protein CBS101457_000726 [Exobasidium rhododendri]
MQSGQGKVQLLSPQSASSDKTQTSPLKRINNAPAKTQTLVNGKGPPRSHTTGAVLPVEQSRKRKVGVLPLVEGALDVGDDGRSMVWLDIDNTLYGKGTQIAHLMTQRIRAYIIGLGIGHAEAERLHQKYYKEYGLAIRGLVMHHKIDALDYDSKCDATLPLEDVLRPDERVKKMLRDLDRSKCRVWALTNAYKTHAVRVLKLLELYDQIEGVIYCDYAQEKFACKPENEFYQEAMQAVGLNDPSRCYFVDDSSLNTEAAKKLEWGHCVLFNEVRQEAENVQHAKDKEEMAVPFSISSTRATNGLSRPLPFSFMAFTAGNLEVERIQSEVRNLAQNQRVELLSILLEACLPGELTSFERVLEKHLRLRKDMISNLPDTVLLLIFEKLTIKELLTCQRVSKRWRASAANPALWESHAMALTEGDLIGMIAPSSPEGWEPLVRGLYFRERNWSKGICQNLTLFKGHTGFVTAMKLKDRKTLVTGSYDETIRVWDLYSGVCKKVLKAKAIACLDFLGEEGILAAGLYDSGRVMVWDMKTWSLLQTLNGHNKGIRNVALNKDYLVSVGQDKAIVVWDWQKGTKLVRFGQQSNVSLGVSIVDHDKIVAVTVDGIIRTFSIRRREMIGQFDVTKLSSRLSSQLQGLKSGNLMLQWFAAHRNTITLATSNLVLHLKWHEHVTPVHPSQDPEGRVNTPQRPRTRVDSNASIASSRSNIADQSPHHRRPSGNVVTTPIKGVPRTSSQNFSQYSTPSRLRSPSTSSQKGSPSSSSSPLPWPRPVVGSKGRSSLTPSTSAASVAAPLSPITHKIREETRSFPSSLSPPTTPASPSLSSQTRMAPNLGITPFVVSILQTPDAAVGCVDPTKKRIVLASRFSSRAGADRRLYTSTLESQSDSSITEDVFSDESVVKEGRGVAAIGGAWQANAEELATPARNPMSLVLDHENCVVGTSEGLVYRMGFVGSEYTHGWIDQQEEDSRQFSSGNDTITDLLQLRSAWSELFHQV